MITSTATNSSPVTALIKGEEAYQWFTFLGKKAVNFYRKGNSNILYPLFPGGKFGLRKSADGKSIRMILHTEGPTLVFTLRPEDSQFLAKNSKSEFLPTQLSLPKPKVALRLLKSLGLGNVEMTTVAARDVIAFAPKIPYPLAKEVASLLADFYKSQNKLRKMVKNVENYYEIRLAYSKTSKIVVDFNTVSNRTEQITFYV